MYDVTLLIEGGGITIRTDTVNVEGAIDKFGKLLTAAMESIPGLVSWDLVTDDQQPFWIKEAQE